MKRGYARMKRGIDSYNMALQAALEAMIFSNESNKDK